MLGNKQNFFRISKSKGGNYKPILFIIAPQQVPIQLLQLNFKCYDMVDKNPSDAKKSSVIE